MHGILRTFVIGSLVSIFPIGYLGVAYNKLSCEQIGKMKVKYATLITILPFFYGLVYLVLTNLISNIKINKRAQLFILGGIAGEIYSLIGHYVLRIPETLLLSKNPNLVHIYAPILYSLIYGIFVYELEKYIK